jgi:MYXO-CTERM domain-containing protein
MDMDELTLSLDFAELLAKIAAGGPASWIVAAVLGLLGLAAYVWWQRKKESVAQAVTEAKAEEALAGTVEVVEAPQSEWAQTGEAIDKLREEAKKKLAESSEAQLGAEPKKLHDVRDSKTGKFVKANRPKKKSKSGGKKKP